MTAEASTGVRQRPTPYGYKAQWGYYTDAEMGILFLTHRYFDPTMEEVSHQRPDRGWRRRQPVRIRGNREEHVC